MINPAYVAHDELDAAGTVVTTAPASAPPIPGWPVAGKTGTSQDFRDAWFVGYTGALVAGVWFGNDNSKPTKKASGGNLPAIAWQRFMAPALDGQAGRRASRRLPVPATRRISTARTTPIVTIGDDGEVLTVAPADRPGASPRQQRQAAARRAAQGLLPPPVRRLTLTTPGVGAVAGFSNGSAAGS